MTPRQLRGDQWSHPFRGVVRPAYVGLTALSEILADAAALAREHGALGGWAALAAHGNTWFDGLGPDGTRRDVLVHCWHNSQIRVRPGIAPSRGLVDRDERIWIGSVEVTTMARAEYDEMRLARNRREAVVVLDMACSTTSDVPHTSIDDVARVVNSHAKTRGIAQARWALGQAVSRSASPWESRTRLMAELDADIHGLQVNVPVFDLFGNLLGIADLIDPATGLVIESDGADHREAQRHTDDNIREEKFERARLVVCRVTSLDHVDRWATVGRIHRARLDASRERGRLWTLEKPDWWHTWKHAPRWE
ncbi:hypothetical protein [Aeromicrobium sp. 9AM]|uniref:hypothetical protein n=1 Tax=Aeromicrobium sp. 9AM TaxID=2653126 RepID=UPI0012F37561|nr:hypothetical protein [Aeromicrobium sp. 9AM]VXC19335.1 conserved hypothetical protein [Aeromicrobium sp. 9AM]